jgi:hypothetical protein
LIDERIVEVSVIPAEPRGYGGDMGIEVDGVYGYGQGAKDLGARERNETEVSVLAGVPILAY